jgi:hypothetical protein
MPGRISSFTGFKAACQGSVETIRWNKTADANSSAPLAVRQRATRACEAREQHFPKIA